MESKKRKAESELSAEESKDTNSINNSSGQHESKSTFSISTTKDSTTENNTAVNTGGFLAYAKTNPFAAAIASNKNPFTATGGLSSFDNSIKSNTSTFGGSALSTSTGFGANKLGSFSMPPPLVVPSPKSPKPNPFSSPSPVHNPFMTIASSSDEVWKTMANDKLSADEAAKAERVSSRSPKRARTGFFGGIHPQNNDSSKDNGSEKNADQVEDTQSSQDNSNDKDGNDKINSPDEEVAATSASSKIYPLPESAVIITGEEADTCLVQMRAKLYRLHLLPAKKNGTKKAEEPNNATDPTTDNTAKPSTGSGASEAKDRCIDANDAEWIEMGVGPLKVLQTNNNDNADSTDVAKSGRIVMRREDKKGGVGIKLILNSRLSSYTVAAHQGDKLIRLICVNHADNPHSSQEEVSKCNDVSTKLGTYLIKTKTAEEAEDLLRHIDNIINDNK